MPRLSGVPLLMATVTSGVLTTLVFYIMIGKVNEKLPEEEKVPYFLSFSYPYFRKPTIVRTEYKRFYPKGQLHVLRVVLQVIALGLAIAAAKQFSYWWR